MRLNPAAFNRFLRAIGQRIAWRQSTACPCTNPFSGAADQSCPQCHGKGHIWGSPVEDVVGVSRQGVDPQWRDFGNFEQGDLTLTIQSTSPLYAMGRFDRVVLLNSTDQFSRVLTRGENDLSVDIPVQEITRCYWLSFDKTQIIEGSIPVWNEVTRALSWPKGGAPDPGIQYSLSGTKFDEYYAYDMLPSDRNEHSGAPLPKRAALKKWDLFGR